MDRIKRRARMVSACIGDRRQGRVERGTGIYGVTTTGLYGGHGDAGSAAGSAGVLGYTNQAGGVAFGTIAAAPAMVAGYFNGTTIVNGNFGVSGTKSAIVKDAAGNHRLMYCVEAPESRFEDIGRATLVNGRADVTLDAEFAALIHTDAYHVFTVSYDASCKGLSVTHLDATGFTVQEQNSGTSSGAFSWRVIAKRGDVKGERLAKFTLPTLTIPPPIPSPEPSVPAQTQPPPAPLPASAPTSILPASVPNPASPRRP